MKHLLIAVALLLTMSASGQNFERIRVLDVSRHITVDPATGVPSGYIEVRPMFRLQLPEALAKLPNVDKVADSYKSMFAIDKIDTINSVLYAIFLPSPITMSIYKVVGGVTTSDLITDAEIKAALQAEYNIYTARLAAFQLMPFDMIIGKSLIGNTWQESE